MESLSGTTAALMGCAVLSVFLSVSAPALGGRKGAESAPGFRLEGLSGEAVVFPDSSGRVAIIHFWASWCKPCKEELPSLSRLARTRAGKLRVIAVAADSEENVRKFLRESPAAGLEVVVDQYGGVVRDYGVSEFPTTFIVHPGLERKARKIPGARDWNESEVTKLMTPE